jgi:hypothetical protein
MKLNSVHIFISYSEGRDTAVTRHLTVVVQPHHDGQDPGLDPTIRFACKIG